MMGIEHSLKDSDGLECPICEVPSCEGDRDGYFNCRNKKCPVIWFDDLTFETEPGRGWEAIGMVAERNLTPYERWKRERE